MELKLRILLTSLVVPVVASCTDPLQVKDHSIVDAAAITSDRTAKDIVGSEPAPPINLDTYVFKEHLYDRAVFVNGELQAVPPGENLTFTTAYAEANGKPQKLEKINDRSRGVKNENITIIK